MTAVTLPSRSLTGTLYPSEFSPWAQRYQHALSRDYLAPDRMAMALIDELETEILRSGHSLIEFYNYLNARR